MRMRLHVNQCTDLVALRASDENFPYGFPTFFPRRIHFWHLKRPEMREKRWRTVSFFITLSRSGHQVRTLIHISGAQVLDDGRARLAL